MGGCPSLKTIFNFKYERDNITNDLVRAETDEERRFVIGIGVPEPFCSGYE
jgi:hypothetical protein